MVKELPVPKQNAELTNKTRQNNGHQHTEEAICSAIWLFVQYSLYTYAQQSFTCEFWRNIPPRASFYTCVPLRVCQHGKN